MLALDLKTGFSLSNAKLFVSLARKVYAAVPDVYNGHTDTAATITEFENAVVVCFRGTKSLQNFLTDARAYRVKRMIGEHQVQIHGGFCDAIESVIDPVLERLSPLMPKPIFAVGHSLGGALARLMGVYMRMAGLGLAGCYTFGEPRSGDAALRDLCNELFGTAHFRIEDESDCVTRVPGWLAGYRHSGQNIFLNPMGGYWLNPVLWKKALSDAWEIYRARSAGPAAVMCLLHDHCVARYEAKVGVLT